MSGRVWSQVAQTAEAQAQLVRAKEENRGWGCLSHGSRVSAERREPKVEKGILRHSVVAFA